MSHSYLDYFRLKATISALRFLDSWSKVVTTHDDSFVVASRDGTREIKVNIYRPKTATVPAPVVLNWHGNAFVFPAHGTDDLFCRRIADRTGYTVLDANYAVAPEYPFPCAVHDVQDVILHVLGQPEVYDTRNIAITGFSSGANLALAAVADLVQQAKTTNATIRAAAVFYPPTNMAIPPAEKKLLDGSAPPVPAVMSLMMNTFRAAYLPPGVDPADPRLSVLQASAEDFPEHVLIFTAEMDRLAPEAEEFARKLEGAGKHVTLKRFEGMRHGWDKTKDEASVEAKLRDEAYDLVIKFLDNVRR